MLYWGPRKEVPWIDPFHTSLELLQSSLQSTSLSPPPRPSGLFVRMFVVVPSAETESVDVALHSYSGLVGSNADRDTIYPYWGFCGFPEDLQENAGIVRQLGHRRIL
jgi:hypothetical protein